MLPTPRSPSPLTHLLLVVVEERGVRRRHVWEEMSPRLGSRENARLVPLPREEAPDLVRDVSAHGEHVTRMTSCNAHDQSFASAA